MSLLIQLNDKIDELNEKSEDIDEFSPQEVLEDHNPVEDNETTPSNQEEQRENVSTLNATAYVACQNVLFAHPLYRRELQIIGQIREPNQKDKLTYSSLERQIHRALKKGHDEGEVVEAVIQAIAPGTKLKSYLESKMDLTLQALR